MCLCVIVYLSQLYFFSLECYMQEVSDRAVTEVSVVGADNMSTICSSTLRQYELDLKAGCAKRVSMGQV